MTWSSLRCKSYGMILFTYLSVLRDREQEKCLFPFFSWPCLQKGRVLHLLDVAFKLNSDEPEGGVWNVHSVYRCNGLATENKSVTLKWDSFYCFSDSKSFEVAHSHHCEQIHTSTYAQTWWTGVLAQNLTKTCPVLGNITHPFPENETISVELQLQHDVLVKKKNSAIINEVKIRH